MIHSPLVILVMILINLMILVILVNWMILVIPRNVVILVNLVNLMILVIHKNHQNLYSDFVESIDSDQHKAKIFQLNLDIVSKSKGKLLHLSCWTVLYLGF